MYQSKLTHVVVLLALAELLKVPLLLLEVLLEARLVLSLDLYTSRISTRNGGREAIGDER